MDDLPAWLKLAHTPGIGPQTLNLLFGRFPGPEAILTATAIELTQAGISPRHIATLQQAPSVELQSLIRTTRQWLSQPLNHLVHRQHTLYPERLKQISDPPTLLYITGDPEVLLVPGVAMVGSRKCTPAGGRTTARLAADLAVRGLTIISGMAYGVDQAAHQAALAQQGLTIAVAGTGLDRVYPARHHELAQQISQNGALVSELPLGAGPKAHHFPRRNRIISGLALGVVIIEAALRSGSLTTARHAIEQGREVMVVPGSINNPLSRGCNTLIREGAILVESAPQILSEIAAQIDTDPRITSGSPSRGWVETPENIQPECNILNLMSFDPITIDSLVALSGQGIQTVTARLAQLELEGHISSLSGGRYVRC